MTVRTQKSCESRRVRTGFGPEADLGQPKEVKKGRLPRWTVAAGLILYSLAGWAALIGLTLGVSKILNFPGPLVAQQLTPQPPPSE